MDDVIIKTLISAHGVLKHNYRTCFPNHVRGSACFEILGFDIMLDKKLKPFILEVCQNKFLSILNPKSRIKMEHYFVAWIYLYLVKDLFLLRLTQETQNDEGLPVHFVKLIHFLVHLVELFNTIPLVLSVVSHQCPP